MSGTLGVRSFWPGRGDHELRIYCWGSLRYPRQKKRSMRRLRMARQSVLKRNKDPDNWIIYVEELGMKLEDMGSTMIDDHPHSCFKQPYI